MTGVFEPEISNNFVTAKTGVSRNYPEKTVFGEENERLLSELDREKGTTFVNLVEKPLFFRIIS